MLTFKTATQADIPLLQQLADKTWHSHYPGIITVEQIDYMLDMMYSFEKISQEIQDGHKWVLIYNGELPIGFMAYVLDKKENKVKLNKLYILSSQHGKGFGQESLDYAKEQACKLKASMLYLTVNKGNIKALKAYTKNGFYKEKELVSDIGNGYVMDDYIMAIKL